MRHEFTNYGQYTNDIEHLIIKKMPVPHFCSEEPDLSQKA